MKPTVKQIEKWCTALRSGEYEQVQRRLQRNDNQGTGYCCLGVACKVFIPEKDHKLNGRGLLEGYGPSEQFAPAWLSSINEDFDDIAGVSLMGLNDGRGFTFDEIADCLEAVYIHKVLD